MLCMMIGINNNFILIIIIIIIIIRIKFKNYSKCILYFQNH